MSLIRQQSKDGIVVDCRNDYIWVVLDQSCQSEGCNVGCGGCSGNKPALKKKVFVDHDQVFSIGQKITLKQSVLNENVSVFLIFGFPLFMAILCSILWYIYNPQKVESPLALLTTGSAFSTGFLIVWIIDTLFRKKFPSTIISSLPVNSDIFNKQERHH